MIMRRQCVPLGKPFASSKKSAIAIRLRTRTKAWSRRTGAGHLGDALGAMREMGVEHANVWALMVRSLDSLVVDAAEQCFLDGQYGPAIKEAYAALEHAIRNSASTTTLPIQSGLFRDSISRVIDPWVRTARKNNKDAQALAEMTKAAFSLIRNPISHAPRRRPPRRHSWPLALAGFLAEHLELAAS